MPRINTAELPDLTRSNVLEPTGKVCVPILASQIDSFDPDSVPTVGKLLLELEELSRRGDTAADWGKTSLRPYVELFEKHAEAVAKEHTRGVKGECFEAPFPVFSRCDGAAVVPQMEYEHTELTAVTCAQPRRPCRWNSECTVPSSPLLL